MKKLFLTILTVLITVSVLSGCGDNNHEGYSATYMETTSPVSFEDYGISCVMEPYVSYTYVADTKNNTEETTIGTVTILELEEVDPLSYQNSEKELPVSEDGFHWYKLTYCSAFSDSNALEYGWTSSMQFCDYYNIESSVDSQRINEVFDSTYYGYQGFMDVLCNGMPLTIQILSHTETVSFEASPVAQYTQELYLSMPTDYDGFVISFYKHRDPSKKYIWEFRDSDTISFRFAPSSLPQGDMVSSADAE